MEELSKYEQKVTGVIEDDIRLEQVWISSKNAADVGRVTKQRANRSTWTFLNSRILDGKVVVFDFPLEIGKKWKNEYRMKRNDSGTTFYSMPVTVEGWEEVEVPAGKFNALKVVNHGSYAVDSAGSSFSSSLTETFWYVPSVKRFVRREFIDPRGDRLRFELLEYAVQ